MLDDLEKHYRDMGEWAAMVGSDYGIKLANEGLNEVFKLRQQVNSKKHEINPLTGHRPEGMMK